MGRLAGGRQSSTGRGSRLTELEDDIRRWTSEWNKGPRPFAWTKPADDILETLAAYSPET